MLDPIAKLHSPTGSLVSVYINRQPPATRAALVDLLKGLSNPRTDARAVKSRRVDIARTVELATEIERSPAPAAAVFTSHHDGIFEFLALHHPVDEIAMVGTRPYLRPLRSQPRPMRAGLLVADAVRARTYLTVGGSLNEHGDELVADRGKGNHGGFAGYEEQRNRARAEEASIQMWRQAGRRLLEVHKDQPLELMLIAGREEEFDAIAAELHPYLQRLPQGRLRADIPALGRADLTALVDREVEKERARRSEALLDRLLAEVGRDGEAVVGLAEVIGACNAHAVEHLVVSGPFSKAGVVCDACGWLGRVEPVCQVCDTETFAVDDIVGAAMDATIEAGGRADVVDIAGPLDAAGVGALLRFRYA